MAEVEAGAPTPADFVVNEAPASTDAPAPDATAAPAVETPEGEKPVEAPKPERTFTQKEVNEIAARRAAQAERQALKVARAEARAELAEKQLQERLQPQTATPGEPDPTKFKDFDSYNAALINHRVEQALAAKLAEREKETTAQQQARLEMQRGETLRQKLAEAEAKHGPEIRDALADPDLPFNGAILAYIEDSKIGGEVAVHLASNRAEAMRIAGLSPVQQVIALHALETKLTAPPKATSAPAPIVPSTPRPSTEKKLEEAESQEEFNAIRRKQIAARKGIWK